ncbi:hypothetical protein Pelo_5725 [Pelomyxa schiedti]|nr:hypothetical protein Pelo_5725 [Pelomyxa schiedti]
MDIPDTRPRCIYGKECYRKNPEHLKQYWHPPQQQIDSPLKQKAPEPLSETAKVPKDLGTQDPADPGFDVFLSLLHQKDVPSASKRTPQTESTPAVSPHDSTKPKTTSVISDPASSVFAPKLTSTAASTPTSTSTLTSKQRQLPASPSHAAETVRALSSIKPKSVSTVNAVAPLPLPLNTDEGCKCVVFPSFGTSSLKFDPAKAATIACSEISSTLERIADPLLRLLLYEKDPVVQRAFHACRPKDSRFVIIPGGISDVTDAGYDCKYFPCGDKNTHFYSDH